MTSHVTPACNRPCTICSCASSQVKFMQKFFDTHFVMPGNAFQDARYSGYGKVTNDTDETSPDLARRSERSSEVRALQRSRRTLMLVAGEDSRDGSVVTPGLAERVALDLDSVV